MSIDDNIMVSVICLAYNHEKYIRQALEGFIMQKASFKFEVIVHDDASTDNTAKIIREYAEEYPSIIKPILQTENQTQKHVSKIKNYILPKTKGKYLAWCEGDDYWIDDNKLEKQVHALEENLNCSACISKVAFINVDGKRTGTYLPAFNVDSGCITQDKYLNYCLYPAKFRTLPFQLSGLMMRRSLYVDYFESFKDTRAKFDTGDMPLFLYVGLNGDVYYLNDVMSEYRTGNPTSWTGKNVRNAEKYEIHMNNMINALEYFDDYTQKKYHHSIEMSIKNRKFLVYQKKRDLKRMTDPDMKDWFNSLSKQRQLTYYISYYLPHIYEILKKIRQYFSSKQN